MTDVPTRRLVTLCHLKTWEISARFHHMWCFTHSKFGSAFSLQLSRRWPPSKGNRGNAPYECGCDRGGEHLQAGGAQMFGLRRRTSKAIGAADGRDRRFRTDSPRSRPPASTAIVTGPVALASDHCGGVGVDVDAVGQCAGGADWGE